MIKKLWKWIIENQPILRRKGNGEKALVNQEKKIAAEEDIREREKYEKN